MVDVLVNSQVTPLVNDAVLVKKRRPQVENELCMNGDNDQQENRKPQTLTSKQPVATKSPCRTPKSPIKKVKRTQCDNKQNRDASDDELSQDDIDHLYRMEVQALYQEFPGLSQKYHIIETLGEGTFSCVYRARSLIHGCDVALKRIFPMSSPKRVANELQLLHLAAGQHHVAQILEGMRYRDTIILVLEHFEHDEFRTYYKRFTLSKLQKYMKALFESLAHIHQLGILHRDVKPSNFLYDFNHDQGLLVDFGLAQRLSPEEENGFPTMNSTTSSDKNQPSTNPSFKSPTRSPALGKLPPITPSPKPPPRSILEREALAASKKRPMTNSNNSNKAINYQPLPNQQMMKAPAKPVGISLTDKRVPLRATRAGTRGFRAPEVLLKSKMQSTAIDVWSAGVILLSILTKRYPFFQSPDDLSALAEIISIKGRNAMTQCAIQLNRAVLVDERAFPMEAPMSLKEICFSLAPEWNEMMPLSVYDLLEKCLALHPMERLSASDALNHVFFKIDQ